MNTEVKNQMHNECNDRHISIFISGITDEEYGILMSGMYLLRFIKPLDYDRASTLAKLTHRSKRETKKLLEKLVKIGLMSYDDESDPDGKRLYGYLPPDDALDQYNRKVDEQSHKDKNGKGL